MLVPLLLRVFGIALASVQYGRLLDIRRGVGFSYTAARASCCAICRRTVTASKGKSLTVLARILHLCSLNGFKNTASDWASSEGGDSAIMKIRSTLSGLAASLAVAFVGPSASAATIDLISNGGFETGTFAGWTATVQAGSMGNLFVNPVGFTAPLSGLSTSGAGGSPHGSFNALSDMNGPGAYALSQSFTRPGPGSLTLMFDLFANDSDSGPIVDPSGLDYTSGGSSNPNQHVRVDILTAAASPLSTSGVDIVTTIIAPMVDPGPIPNPFTTYVFDLSALLAVGGTYQLRFGEVDNQLFLNMGVDNVKLLAEVRGVPEPATFALLGLSLAGVAVARRRKRTVCRVSE